MANWVPVKARSYSPTTMASIKRFGPVIAASSWVAKANRKLPAGFCGGAWRVALPVVIHRASKSASGSGTVEVRSR
ncbi:hypothetical protein Amsp01_042570 [Amycolatopsis sp. NBRC 101858]|nr:hypothetical protein Amsp01_042570 [Amycolatopsis sp. NBRC 101858]